MRLGEAPHCFILAATVMDVKCSLSSAERLIRDREGRAAAAALRDVMKKSVRLARLCPDGAAQARKLRDEAHDLSRIALAPAPRFGEARISEHMTHLYSHLDRVYASAKRRCRVPKALDRR